MDFDGKENIQSKKRNDNGKIHESSVKSRRPQTSSTRMRRISYRERPKKSKSLQLQKPKQSKQSSRREKTRRKGKRRRSKSPQICRTAIYEEESANGSSDEEILELRLEALSSKAEVKEIAETGGIENIQTLNMSKPIEGVIRYVNSTH